MLCSRHNEALSSLDAVALQALGNIVDAMTYVTMKSLATRKALYAASGEGLELWALMLLFGAYHATIAGEDSGALKNFRPLEFSIFQTALERGALAAPCGLYISRSAEDTGWAPRETDTTKPIVGMRFQIGPLECALIVDPTGLNFDAMRRENFYRPCGIDLSGKKRGAHIHLSGPGFATNESARLTLSEMRPGE